MAMVSIYNPRMLMWLIRLAVIGTILCKSTLTVSRECQCVITGSFAEGKRYTTIPIMLVDEIHDVYITEGVVNGEKFTDFTLLPILLPFNNVNPYSVVVMDNASIHNVCEVDDLVIDQAGARLCYLPPYSSDLMPAEES